MIPLCILLISFPGVINEEQSVNGSVGGSLSLPSGADQSWSLSVIEWFTGNNTYLATYKLGGKVTYFSTQNRLRLNTSSGNLEIMDVQMEDGGAYKVYLKNTQKKSETNTVILSVYEHLPRPAINVVQSVLKDGLCWIFLNCSVESSNNVTFDWMLEPPPYGCYGDTKANTPMGSELTAWCNPIRAVNITCTVNGDSSNAYTKTTMCSGEDQNISKVDPKTSTLKCDCKYGGVVVMGLFIGLILATVLAIVLWKKSMFQSPSLMTFTSCTTVCTKKTDQIGLANDFPKKPEECGDDQRDRETSTGTD